MPLHRPAVDLLLLEARVQLVRRSWHRPELVAYLRGHDIDLDRVLPHIGGVIGLLDVVEKPNDRFDYFGPGNLITSLVFEAVDADGETAFDLVAVPVGEPRRPMTMFGRVGFLNRAAVFSPGSYTFDKPMPVYRTALTLLSAGWNGTAIIHSKVAAREMLDIPGGRLVGEDIRHHYDLRAIARSVNDERLLVRPQTARRA